MAESPVAHFAAHRVNHGIKEAFKAWGGGATLLSGLGAGATATVGGTAVVAAAVAAAPFVIGAAVIGGIGVGVYKLFEKEKA